MKNITRILSLTLLATIGMNAAYAATPVKPVMLKNARQLTGFSGVAIGGSIHAYVTIGDKENIRLEGDKEAIAALTTEVRNGILTIRPKTKWMEWGKKFRNSKITAYITAKRINSLSMEGSGTIEVKSVVNSGDLAIALRGSGDIKLSANVKSLAAAISGSGNIHIDGKAAAVTASIDGSGNINGRNLNTTELTAQISGSGNMYVNASKIITASISGSGSVHYSGNPAITKSVSGSGSVRKD